MPSRSRISSLSRYVLRLSVLAAAVACGVSSLPFAMAAAQATPLSPKDRAQVFETVWKEIRDTYYDPKFHGVNWAEVRDRYRPQLDSVPSDPAFYQLLNRMAGELHDAHTRVSSPAQWENRQKQQGVSLGFDVREVDGKVVVTEAYPDSEASKAGVEPGMIVVRMNGQSIADRIADVAKGVPGLSTERIQQLRIVSSALAGPAGSSATIDFERADGTNVEATITRQVRSFPPDVRSQTLPSGDGYIRFDGFQLPVINEFKDALTGFHAAPAVIIDLRWNSGGRGDVVTALAGYFYDKPTVLAKYMTRKDVSASESSRPNEAGHRETIVHKNGDQLYAGPVVILTDLRSGSSSELFAGGMQETGRAKVVGGQTCGCVIGIAQNHRLKGGGVLEVSQILWFTPGGRKLEGDGVIPDLAVAPTIPDIRQKRDAVLDAAERLLHPSLRPD